MTGFTETAYNVFAPTDAGGNPRKVDNADTQRWGTEVERLIMALIAGAGGDIDLPNLLIRYTVTGGSANAITATPNLPVPSGPGLALFSIQIQQANTGPVTINGKPLLTNTGNNLSADGLAAGGMYLFLDNGDHFRLLTDEVSSAIVAAAEAAAVRAEDAAAGLNLPTIGAGDAGKTLVVKEDESGFELAVPSITTPTRTSMKAIPALNAGQTVFLTEAGREGTFILKAGSPPVTDTQEGIYVVSDTAGYYWERVCIETPTVRLFGAKQDNVSDDTAAVQGALDVLGVAYIDSRHGLKLKIAGTIRLKNARNQLIGIGWPWLVQGTVTPIFVESNFQKVQGLVIDGTAATAQVPAIRIRTSLRQLTTIEISDIYGVNCFGGIMDDDAGNFVAIFVNIRDVTLEGHRGYGVYTGDCWASYHIDQVVVDRVGKTGTAYNYPGFYFNGAEGIFFRNCAQNGSAGTGIQPLQDGAVFENCNFVVFENFIPDHSGGRGLVFINCANVKGDRSTLVNCGSHGLVASGGSMFDLDSITATQIAGGAASSDAFNVDNVVGFRARGLYGTGFKRNGFFGNAIQRANVQGEFSNNANRGIVTLGAGSANIFHGCITANNTAGNYSLSGGSDYLRDHIISAGTIADITGPATA